MAGDLGIIGGITGAMGGAQGAGGGLGSVAGGLIGGLTGMLGGNGFDAAAEAKRRALEAYLAEIKDIRPPTYEDLQRFYQTYSEGETLAPEMLGTVNQGDTNLAGVKTDPAYKATMMDTLSALRNEANEGGLTLQDRAKLLEASREIDRQSQGQNASIMQNMQQRGIAGGGMELAAKLANTQNGATLASKNALDVAANSRTNMLNSLRDASSIAGQMDTTDYNRGATVAKSRDDITRANLERLQNSMKYNVGAKNMAQESNVNRANSVLDKNTGLKKEEQDTNKNLMTQVYDTKMNRAATINNARQGIANNDLESAKNAATGYANIGKAIPGVIKGARDWWNSDDNSLIPGI